MSAPPAASAHQENRREKGHIKQNRSKELPTPTIAFELKFPHFLNVVKAPFPIFFAFGRKNPLRSQYFKKIIFLKNKKWTWSCRGEGQQILAVWSRFVRTFCPFLSIFPARRGYRRTFRLFRRTSSRVRIFLDAAIKVSSLSLPAFPFPDDWFAPKPLKKFRKFPPVLCYNWFCHQFNLAEENHESRALYRRRRTDRRRKILFGRKNFPAFSLPSFEGNRRGKSFFEQILRGHGWVELPNGNVLLVQPDQAAGRHSKELPPKRDPRGQRLSYV